MPHVIEAPSRAPRSYRTIVSTLRTSGFVVSDAVFPAGIRAPRHTHSLACLAFLTEGGYDETFDRTTHRCVTGTVVIEPPNTTSANGFTATGARVLLVEVQPWRYDSIHAYSQVLNAPAVTNHGPLASLARRLHAEISFPDPMSPLVVEGLLLEATAEAARSARADKQMPRWLKQVGELIRDRFRGPLSLEEIAVSVDKHPAHVSRAFRAQHRASIGEYIRGLRITWATEQLARTALPIGTIALAAGYSDQSHFTRAFVKQHGMSPSRYRDEVRR